MKLYTFASKAPAGLFAFTADPSGSPLPERHGPWESIGDVGAREAVPHRLDREHIEEAIGDHGYQMWRMKKVS